MERVKTILVRAERNEMEVLPTQSIPFVVVEKVDASNALERVRCHFERSWGAKVHALRWILPGDLLLPIKDPGPFLILHVDEVGQIPFTRIQCGSPRGSGDEGLSSLLIEASRPCSFQPWSEPNWLSRTSDWILRTFDFDRVRHISQIRVTATGAVLKIEGHAGTYFLKTLPWFLAYEGPLVSFLSANLSRFVPRVLACRPDATSYLACAVNGAPLSALDESDQWTNVLRDMAQIQIESSRFINEMRFSGMSCQSFDEFAAGVGPILEDLVALQSGLRNRLTCDEEAQMPALLALAIRDCNELQKCGLPDTLVHGDPNESNIFCQAGECTTLIDWAFSRITHPFFVLKGLCASMGSPKHRMHPVREQVKTAYLNSWQEYSSRPQLTKGLDAASRLMWIESTHHLAKLFRCLKEEEPGNLLLVPRMLRQALGAYGLWKEDKRES